MFTFSFCIFVFFLILWTVPGGKGFWGIGAGGGRLFEKLGFPNRPYERGFGVFVYDVGFVGMMGEVIMCTNIR